MFKIALRNVLRNIRRSMLTGLSITAGVMIAIYMWSFISGIADNAIDNFIRLSSGHIRILDSDYIRREKMLPLEANIANPKKIQQIVDADKEVTLSTGHIKFGVLLEYKGKNQPVMGIGIEPIKENQISHLDQKIIQGREIVAGMEEMNIGEKLAKELGLKVGDTLTVVTQTAYGSITAMNLKIVGIFRYGVPSIDGTTFYMPLDKAQKLLDLDDRVTEIFVLVKNMDQAPQIAARLKTKLAKGLEPKPWQDQGILFFWMRLAKFIYGTVYMLILFLASFTILNTMFMAVLERTKEIGMMKSLGMKNREIITMVLYEAMLIGAFASFLGAILGGMIAYYLATYGIDFTAIFERMGNFKMPVSYVYRGMFAWSIIFAGFCLGIFFSVLAAIPPALRAAKMQPSESLREL